jgi:hypothetical protein
MENQTIFLPPCLYGHNLDEIQPGTRFESDGYIYIPIGNGNLKRIGKWYESFYTYKEMRLWTPKYKDIKTLEMKRNKISKICQKKITKVWNNFLDKFKEEANGYAEGMYRGDAISVYISKDGERVSHSYMDKTTARRIKENFVIEYFYMLNFINKYVCYKGIFNKAFELVFNKKYRLKKKELIDLRYKKPVPLMIININERLYLYDISKSELIFPEQTFVFKE